MKPGHKFSDEINQARQAFGKIHWLDYREESLVSAHYLLGKEVTFQALFRLEQKIRQLPSSEFLALITLARRQRAHLQQLIADHDHGEIISLYLQCLKAWAEGARLEIINQLPLDAFDTQIDKPSGIDYALFLQNDSYGCQTGLYRHKTGDIYGWHTEEDVSEPGERFDRIRMAIFRVNNSGQPVDVFSFIYPDLMPGPAFAWRSDQFIQMVDSLYLRQIDGILLANIAAWANLMVGSIDRVSEIIHVFAPYLDGYALNEVKNYQSHPTALKVEFAGSAQTSQWLGDVPGDYLFQVNIISQRGEAFCREYEEIRSEKLSLFLTRIDRSHQAITHFGQFDDVRQPIFELLCSVNPDGEGYVNKYVKSFIYFHMSPSRLEISLGSGPASPNDTPIMFVYEVK